MLIDQSGQKCKLHIITLSSPVQFYTMATCGTCCCCRKSDLSTSQTKRRKKKVHSSLKNMVGNIGGIVSPQAIVKAAKSLGPVQHVCSVFKGQTVERKVSCDHHSFSSIAKDLKKVVDILREENIFTPLSKRSHPTFDKLKCEFFQNIQKMN